MTELEKIKDIQDNYYRNAKVVKVIDGDTVEVDIDLGFYTTVRHRVRLLRVNTPETKGETREKGLVATDFTKKAILNKDVVLFTHKTDSFKRWLGEIYYEENGKIKNMSDELLKSGNAIEFVG